jgi:hypothetical protein
MNTPKGSNTFTSSVAQQICILLDKKIGLSSIEQLKISKQIRALGFYGHDFVEGLPDYDRWSGMTSYNFNWLVDDGRIVIVD